MKVLQIVPRLHPCVCGVGDYALELAREWRARHGIETSFLVGDPAWRHGNEVDGFFVHRVRERTASALHQAVKEAASDVVVLQYSGYGFHERGAPLWLARGLRRARLITMFHELYATGGICSSAFWLSPLMRWTTRKLAGHSRHVFCNRAASAEWLGCGAEVLPVFSNLGERADLPPPSLRKARLVLFGHQFESVNGLWQRLREAVDRLGAASLVVLSRPLSPPHDWPSEIPVESHGILTAEKISEVLADCRWGMVSYPPAFLGKSGILAAFFAHGVVPLFFERGTRGELSEGVNSGVHVSALDRLGDLPDAEALDRMSKAGHAWYRQHDLTTAAARYAKAFSHLSS